MKIKTVCSLDSIAVGQVAVLKGEGLKYLKLLLFFALTSSLLVHKCFNASLNRSFKLNLSQKKPKTSQGCERIMRSFSLYFDCRLQRDSLGLKTTSYSTQNDTIEVNMQIVILSSFFSFLVYFFPHQKLLEKSPSRNLIIIL